MIDRTIIDPRKNVCNKWFGGGIYYGVNSGGRFNSQKEPELLCEIKESREVEHLDCFYTELFGAQSPPSTLIIL